MGSASTVSWLGSAYLRCISHVLGAECVACGQAIQKGPLCAGCREFPRFVTEAGLSEQLESVDSTWSQFEYTQAASRWVRGIKDSARFDWYFDMEKSLLIPQDLLLHRPVCVAVPSFRGLLGDICHLALGLAESLAHKYGLRLLSPLKKIKRIPKQRELSQEERLLNPSGAFRCDNLGALPSVLLVDDVYTTGSTVNECARVLKEAGAGRIDVWTLFRAKLRGPSISALGPSNRE